MNPLELIAAAKSGNPRQIATQIIRTNYSNDPLMTNLLDMAEKGNTQGIQQFASQFFKSQGLNFNNEMNKFMSAVRKA